MVFFVCNRNLQQLDECGDAGLHLACIGVGIVGFQEEVGDIQLAAEAVHLLTLDSISVAGGQRQVEDTVD